MTEKLKETIDRFWAKVNKTDGCWLWTGCLNSKGYGNFRFNGQPQLAHRVSWMIEHGEAAPANKGVLHRCDNPVCVNPSHLFLGTQADNVADMISKGRKAILKGEECSNVRLTDDQVYAIRRLRKSGETLVSIARKFNVNFRTVSIIANQKAWKHLPDSQEAIRCGL